VILVLLPSAVVGVGRSVLGAVEIVLDLFCRVSVTGLPDCGLGCGYDLACYSVWRMAMGGGFTLFVP